jgi:hypothetical protein
MDLTQTVKVTAIMTAGRYENTWCRNQIDLALSTLRIPLAVSGGVFYGQCMQNMLNKAMSDGCEYAITVDWDSVFTAAQVQRLLSIAVQERDIIDALCAMQIRRGMTDILGTIDGGTKLYWDGYPVKLDTAHFGLTVINLAKLKDTPKPWFFCQPDSEGDWTGDKIDSDVWFWRQWQKSGNSLYMDPGTSIGHLEEIIAIRDDSTVRHIYPADWEAYCNGKVVEAVEELSSGVSS